MMRKKRVIAVAVMLCMILGSFFANASEISIGAQSVMKANGSVVLDSPENAEFAALIPDANFRKVIYQSMENYGWLSGDPQNPPQSIQEILETYTGPVDGYALNKEESDKISSIEGIQYLKMATTADSRYEIDLTGNRIEDITPITNVCTADNYYYGYRRINPSRPNKWEGAKVKINLLHNPLRCIPKTEGKDKKFGYLTFASLTGSSPEYTDDKQYYYLRNNSETFSEWIRIGYCQYDSMDPGAEYIHIGSVQVASFWEGGNELVFQQSDQGPNQNKDMDALLSNIRRSNFTQLDISAPDCLRTTGINPSGVAIPDTTSMAYSMYVNVTVFDKVEMQAEYSGRAQLQKIDQATGRAVNGAVYNFYRRESDGSSTLLRENLTTGIQDTSVYDDASGTYRVEKRPGYTEIIENLEPGTYFFKEVSAPFGYQMDESEIEVQIDSMLPAISGGIKELDYTSSNGQRIEGSAADNETYLTWNMDKDAHLFLKNDSGEEYDDTIENGAIASVNLTYQSLDGSDTPVVKHFRTLQEAEDDLNNSVANNLLTGSVKIDVVYDQNSYQILKIVTGSDEPYWTQVSVQKLWVGLEGTEVLPEVTYCLYGNTDGSSEPKEINRYTVPAGSTDYSYTFVTDKEGNRLPQYTTDNQGNVIACEYTVKEICDSEDYQIGAIGPPTELNYTEGTGESGISEKVITIPIKNVKLASIKIIKVDADDPTLRLSDVEFKLEKESDEGVWKEIASEKTNDMGEVIFGKLESGSYRVTETKTKNGYQLLKEPILVTIGDLGNGETKRKFEYTVENSRRSKLPDTGGFGIETIISEGLLCMMAICTLFIRQQSLRRKRGKEL